MHVGLLQLDGPGIESGRGWIFRIRPEQPRCPSSLLGRGLIGQGVALTTPSSAEAKERVQLYLYSQSVFMADYRVTFTFTVQHLAAQFARQVNIQGYCTDGSVCKITFLTVFY